MGKVKDTKKKVSGFISAFRTMLDNYPQPQVDSRLMSLLDSTSVMGFLINLVGILGLSQEDLLNWLSKILCGKEVIKNKLKINKKELKKRKKGVTEKSAQGILDIIEYSIKTILLLNVKNMFTCSLNPFIPNDVLKYPDGGIRQNGASANGKGIKIPISTIDLYNTLDYCPTDQKRGCFFYFDNDCGTNDVWKSTDFNAFLWYIINKSVNVGEEKFKCIWDNRVKYFAPNVWSKEDKFSTEFKNNFFNIALGEDSYVQMEGVQTADVKKYPNKPETKTEKRQQKKNKNTKIKKQFIIVEYNEQESAYSVPNSLTVWLNADRYRYFNTDMDGTPLYLNRTVFEFNYDFIFSLKLFDSRTIVTHVINAVLGIGNSAVAAILNTKYSIQQKLIEGKVGEIVKKIVNGEDDTVNDDFFSFSNDELNNMLEETELKRYNNYTFGETYGSISESDMDNILSGIENIGSSASLNEVQTNIANVFSQVASVTAATSDEVEISDEFSFGANIITKLIEECVVQIVMQVLSPKVMLLFALNSYFMGDVTDGDFSKINVTQFLKGLQNLIVSIVKQVFEIIMKQLIQFILDKIKELVMLIIEKLLLERIRFYIELFKRLLALLQMFYNTFANIGKNGAKTTSIIDNVNYADIVPPQTEPKNNQKQALT